MKTRYKYIHFVKLLWSKQQSEDFWGCFNNKTGDRLGTVDWFDNWQQYELSTSENAGFTIGCLRDIADFMQQLKELR